MIGERQRWDSYPLTRSSRPSPPLPPPSPPVVHWMDAELGVSRRNIGDSQIANNRQQSAQPPPVRLAGRRRRTATGRGRWGGGVWRSSLELADRTRPGLSQRASLSLSLSLSLSRVNRAAINGRDCDSLGRPRRAPGSEGRTRSFTGPRHASPPPPPRSPFADPRYARQVRREERKRERERERARLCHFDLGSRSASCPRSRIPPPPLPLPRPAVPRRPAIRRGTRVGPRAQQKRLVRDARGAREYFSRAGQVRGTRRRERRGRKREQAEIHLRIGTADRPGRGRTSRRGITGINTSRNYRARGYIPGPALEAGPAAAGERNIEIEIEREREGEGERDTRARVRSCTHARTHARTREGPLLDSRKMRAGVRREACRSAGEAAVSRRGAEVAPGHASVPSHYDNFAGKKVTDSSAVGDPRYRRDSPRDSRASGRQAGKQAGSSPLPAR